MSCFLPLLKMAFFEGGYDPAGSGAIPWAFRIFSEDLGWPLREGHCAVYFVQRKGISAL